MAYGFGHPYCLRSHWWVYKDERAVLGKSPSPLAFLRIILQYKCFQLPLPNPKSPSPLAFSRIYKWSLLPLPKSYCHLGAIPRKPNNPSWWLCMAWICRQRPFMMTMETAAITKDEQQQQQQQQQQQPLPISLKSPSFPLGAGALSKPAYYCSPTLHYSFDTNYSLCH